MVLDIAVLAISVVCFLSFAWGVRKFFTWPSGKTWPMYLVSEVGTLIALTHMFFLYRAIGDGAWVGDAVAVALYLAGLGLFWWSVRTNQRRPLSFAYSDDSPEHLVKHGPYGFVRHPFYTAYTMGWLAAPVAVGEPWLLLTTAFMFIVYRQSAVQEERKFLESELAEDYRQYLQQTGRFLPRLL